MVWPRPRFLTIFVRGSDSRLFSPFNMFRVLIPPPPAIGVRKPTVHIDKYQQILQINILDEKWVGIFNIKKWYKERKDKNERVQVDSFN